MQYRVTLHNGQGFNITGEIAADDLVNKLNNRDTLFINLGGCIVQKNTVATVLPVTESPTTTNAQ